MREQLLIVEDDPAIARVLRDSLTFHGFDVVCAADGVQALNLSRQRTPDLVVLDIRLPGCNGFDLISSLRQGGCTAVVVLTACVKKTDRVRGLDLGADDYITKPFDLEEFMARVRAVLRRARPDNSRLTLDGNLVVDFSARTVTRDGRSIHLTHLEFELLRYLAERIGKIVHRDALHRGVWGYAEVSLTRSVDNAIVRLRRKLEIDPGRPRFIHTVRGDGYLLASAGKE